MLRTMGRAGEMGGESEEQDEEAAEDEEVRRDSCPELDRGEDFD